MIKMLTSSPDVGRTPCELLSVTAKYPVRLLTAVISALNVSPLSLSTRNKVPLTAPDTLANLFISCVINTPEPVPAVSIYMAVTDVAVALFNLTIPVPGSALPVLLL
jgi:hypothetical protein